MSTTSSKHLPPVDGSINVIPGFVDFHAEKNTERPWVKFPSAADPTQVEVVTFSEYARATHRIAHALRPAGTGTTGEVVAVIIHCDTIHYLALLAGIIRAGYVAFPMSPRNSPEAVCQMLQKTSCRRIVFQPIVSALTSAVESLMAEKQTPIELIPLPELSSIYPSLGGKEVQVVEPYPVVSALSKPDDIVLYLHSSGSTGFPKPIPQTNRTLLQWACTPCLYQSRDHNLRWISAPLPTFHTMGIIMQFYCPLVCAEYIALYTPQAPAPPVTPSPQNILDVSMLTKCNAVPVVPSIVEIWTQSPATVEYLKSLDIVAFAGGPLSDVNGAKLAAAGVKLFSVYGATEFGVPTNVFDTDDSQGPDAVFKTSADWAWMQFADYVNSKWVPQGDGTYELQFLTCPTHTPSVENLPNEKGYATSDLWEPHPTKKGLWKIVGRTDDVIVLGSGEKVVPLPQEGYLSSVSFVSGALMFGRGQAQAGLLVEPRPETAIDPNNEKALTEFRNKIWPHVEEANKLAPTFARIFKEMIIVTDPTRPLPRAAKGTAMRKMALGLYAQEVDQLYETVLASIDANGVDPPSSWTVEAVEEWLVEHATMINKGLEPSATADIFEQGFDSLSATYLRNRIIGALRSSADATIQQASIQVPQDFIFSHSTLQKLAVAVVHLIYPNTVPEEPKTLKEQIVDFVAKYSAGIPDFKAQEKVAPTGGAVVLLTGSTGNLGSHILAFLLASPGVKKVYTLDRGIGPKDRLKSSFENRELPVDVLESDKLVSSVGDLSKSDLGLDALVLEEIQSSVTHIVHNAWKLDFNLSVSSFESHIAGSRQLVEFSASCVNAVKYIFSSSIASAQGWDAKHGLVPEEILEPDVAIGTGYGSSKYVVQKVLETAKANGLDTISVRIGQLSGSSTSGAWNLTDWVPIIVRSSIALGCLPDLSGVVDWVPVDVAAHAIVDIVESSMSSLPGIVNLVHPQPVSWTEVFAAVNKSVEDKLQIVSFSEWLTKVDALSANASVHDFFNVPAIKLIRFFRGVEAGSLAHPDSPHAGGRSGFDNTKAQEMSKSLRDTKSIGHESVRLWLKHWEEQSPEFFQSAS